jgi:hypothetical protein
MFSVPLEVHVVVVVVLEKNIIEKKNIKNDEKNPLRLVDSSHASTRK